MDRVPYRVIDGPSTNEEPIGPYSVSQHLRISRETAREEDWYLQSLCEAAREFCENYTGRAFARQTLEAYPEPGMRSVLLPKPNVSKIIRVAAYLADGTEKELDSSTYSYDEASGRLFLDVPTEPLRSYSPLVVTYEAGGAGHNCRASGPIPATVRQAMFLLVAHWYENREAVVVGSIASIEVQQTVRTLLNQHKVWWF